MMRRIQAALDWFYGNVWRISILSLAVVFMDSLAGDSLAMTNGQTFFCYLTECRSKRRVFVFLFDLRRLEKPNIFKINELVFSLLLLN